MPTRRTAHREGPVTKDRSGAQDEQYGGIWVIRRWVGETWGGRQGDVAYLPGQVRRPCGCTRLGKGMRVRRIEAGYPRESPERGAALGRRRYADWPARHRGTGSSSTSPSRHPGASTDPLRREGPAEREGDLYDVNGNRRYPGWYRGPGNLFGARSWLDYGPG